MKQDSNPYIGLTRYLKRQKENKTLLIYITVKTHISSFLAAYMLVSANVGSEETLSMPWSLEFFAKLANQQCKNKNKTELFEIRSLIF